MIKSDGCYVFCRFSRLARARDEIPNLDNPDVADPFGFVRIRFDFSDLQHMDPDPAGLQYYAFLDSKRAYFLLLPA